MTTTKTEANTKAALALVRLNAAKATRALEHRDLAIVEALAEGASSRAVADAAGMTSPGVLAVRKRLEENGASS